MHNSQFYFLISDLTPHHLLLPLSLIVFCIELGTLLVLAGVRQAASAGSQTGLYKKSSGKQTDMGSIISTMLDTTLSKDLLD